MIRKLKKLSSAQIIIFGFAAVVLIGALLLMLPISTVQGKGAGFADSLFTAVSSVCVTGLIVKDTATYWSVFGQFVILIMIQIGGMGIVTAAVSLSMISGRRIGLMQRSTMQESISAPSVGGIVRLTGFVLTVMFICELVGAMAMAPVFCKDFGILKGIWYSVFHSVSAFCNAGFDLMGARSEFSSLTTYADNPVINISIILLIIIGGIGFITWDDIRKNHFKISRYRMQSKLILTFTAFIIIIPAIYFFFFEFNDMPIGKRLLVSIFQAVTPRTAGFNTVDASALSETGNSIVILLMLIGGAPGSTAGGMKITTVAIILLSSISVIRHRDSAHCYGRRISSVAVKSAATVLTMYVGFFLLGGFIISRIEGIDILSSLYETASAICTVGLTTGITPQLGQISRCILMLLMFIGRVGGLTLVFAVFSNDKTKNIKYPQENITVG